MKTFKELFESVKAINEASQEQKAKKQARAARKQAGAENPNVEALDINKPYKTPEDIKNIMSSSAGDDAIDYSDLTDDPFKAFHGVEDEDITPRMRREREASAALSADVGEPNIGWTRSGNLLSDAEIGKKFGISKDTVRREAQVALLKLHGLLSSEEGKEGDTKKAIGWEDAVRRNEFGLNSHAANQARALLTDIHRSSGPMGSLSRESGLKKSLHNLLTMHGVPTTHEHMKSLEGEFAQ